MNNRPPNEFYQYANHDLNQQQAETQLSQIQWRLAQQQQQHEQQVTPDQTQKWGSPPGYTYMPDPALAYLEPGPYHNQPQSSSPPSLSPSSSQYNEPSSSNSFITSPNNGGGAPQISSHDLGAGAGASNARKRHWNWGSEPTERAKKRLIQNFEHLSLCQPNPLQTSPAPAPAQAQPEAQAQAPAPWPQSASGSSGGGAGSDADYMDTSSSTTIFIPSIDDFLRSEADEPTPTTSSAAGNNGEPPTWPVPTLSASALQSFLPASLVYGLAPQYNFYERPSRALLRYVPGGAAQVVHRAFVAAYYRCLEEAAGGGGGGGALCTMQDAEAWRQRRFQVLEDNEEGMMVDENGDAEVEMGDDPNGDMPMDLDD